MTEGKTSPLSLFNQLTAFSYWHDPEFKSGDTDTMDCIRSSKLGTAILRCDETAETQQLYDTKKIAFYAERPHTEEDFRQSENPTVFKIHQELITQLPDGIPCALREQIAEGLEDYDTSLDKGDFNTVHYVHYAVERDEDGEIIIDRNIGYTLRDYETVLYDTSEIIGQPEPVLVPIAHRQQTLRVYAPIKEDSVDDKIQQVSFNAIFEDIFDGGSNAEFFHEFVKLRHTDATMSILALVACLKERRAIPDHLVL
ncbi:MAG: hypothetical protein JWM07_216 [Candidatus Saccharibacteria bacterium]|nr:hypothetical protein [Candidatus Saccharibacteria bacterium]